MIPRKIHYCWFGRGEMPQLAKDCIASWHKYMPDWEYKLWNEENFNVEAIPYTAEAYAAGKYAFVTDYVRLYALKTEGGVYMDTDVEILKPLDDLLHLTAFTGYEGSKHRPPVTGLMASEAGGEWVTEQLEDYRNAHFIQSDGSYDMTTNTCRISRIMQANGFVCDGNMKQYKDLTVFPTEYFCPHQTTGEYLRTENTYCNHLFMASWNDCKSVGWKGMLRRIIGNERMVRLIKWKRKWLE
ncbi:MAG: glycosyl transferase [Bacteroidales bacterium]|nr:glycosyl transferase [Bacteroidales bacterium]